MTPSSPKIKTPLGCALIGSLTVCATGLVEATPPPQYLLSTNTRLVVDDFQPAAL
jgi:hypothetical protein